MATRSMIAFHNGDSVYAIYCHNDGYLDCNGRILLKHYTDIEKVEELMDLGNLSCLGEEIGQEQAFYKPTSHRWCLAYGRDRGEKGNEAGTFSTVEEAVSNFDGCDYFYVFDGNRWVWRDSSDAWVWSELTKEDIYA